MPEIGGRHTKRAGGGGAWGIWRGGSSRCVARVLRPGSVAPRPPNDAAHLIRHFFFDFEEPYHLGVGPFMAQTLHRW